MKYLKIFLIVIFFSIFRYFFFGSNSPEDCQLTYQVLNRVANKISHKYQARRIGNGEIAYKIWPDSDSSDSRFVIVEKHDEAIAKMNEIKMECK